jgi:hypothetical protein
MPGPLPLSTEIWIKLAAAALAAAGFSLVPEDPAFPALLLTAVALPLALLFTLAYLLLERREAARTKAAAAAEPSGKVPTQT